MERPRAELAIILGPTAGGKTSLSLSLSKFIDCEIISADSMQIYREMDIGTDKIPRPLRDDPPHHLIDIISPEEEFSVARYKELAREKISRISGRGNLPVMVGGTGLYINSVIEDYLIPDMPAGGIREAFYKYADKWGRKRLHSHLEYIDPEYAARIHPNDLKRVSRALEIYYMTGRTRTFYEFLQRRKPPRYRMVKIGVWRERSRLYSRIEDRVEEMFERGLLEEVEYLCENYDLSLTARQALGYKELFGYLEDEISLEEAKRLIKKRTRNLAKKQLTFFKRDSDIIWVNPDYRDNLQLSVELGRILQNNFLTLDSALNLDFRGI